eukprot:6463081-Prymnesium_polylepis.1
MLQRQGDITYLALASEWLPTLPIEVTGLGKAEIWFAASKGQGGFTFRVLVEVKPSVPVVRLGVLLPMFGTVAAGYNAITWSARGGAYQALR